MMSKRLQVILPDREYSDLSKLAKRSGVTVSEFVRDAIRRAAMRDAGHRWSAEERLARIMRFAKLRGPTGDIEQVLEEIEKGRNL